MSERSQKSDRVNDGWHALLQDYPWFAAEGRYPLAAYSEFLPPPRLGRTAYGELDPTLFSAADPFGWNVSELEEEYELAPGLRVLAQQIMGALRKLGQAETEHTLAGHEGRNLRDNPYWPDSLAARAGHLLHEHYVLLLPLALSRTQDDMGRVRWTFLAPASKALNAHFGTASTPPPVSSRP